MMGYFAHVRPEQCVICGSDEPVTGATPMRMCAVCHKVGCQIFKDKPITAETAVRLREIVNEMHRRAAGRPLSV